jgi:Fis family transcriptional regulator, factor for inversion stimulation protein
MNSINSAVLEFTGEVMSPSNPTLRQSVKEALEKYLQHLDDQPPVNLHKFVLEEIEAPLFEVVMRVTKNNQSKAAKLLGLNRGTLRKKLKQYHLDN